MIIISFSPDSHNTEQDSPLPLDSLFPSQVSEFLNHGTSDSLMSAIQSRYFSLLDELLDQPDGTLICHEWIPRSFVFYGSRLFISICRVMDTSSGKTHRVLPDFLVPHARITRSDLEYLVSEPESVQPENGLDDHLLLPRAEVLFLRNHVLSMLKHNTAARSAARSLFSWGRNLVRFLFPPAFGYLKFLPAVF